MYLWVQYHVITCMCAYHGIRQVPEESLRKEKKATEEKVPSKVCGSSFSASQLKIGARRGDFSQKVSTARRIVVFQRIIKHMDLKCMQTYTR